MTQESTTPQRPKLSAAVSKHLKRLSRRSHVRSIAERLCVGEVLTEGAIDGLISGVEEKSGRRWRERLVAAACLGECALTPEQWQRATAALRSVLTDRRFRDLKGRISRGAQRTWAVSTSIVGVLAAGQRFTMNAPFSDTMLIWIAIWLVGVAVSGAFLSALLAPPTLVYSGARERSNLRRSMEEVLRSLGKLADPMAGGLLARAQGGSTRLVSLKAREMQAARDALPAVLAAVREEHYGLLPTDATPALAEALAPKHYGIIPPDVVQSYENKLTLAILGALGRAGDGRAAEAVRSLAKNSPYEPVRTAAAEVLPILEERLRNETAAARLLRPASSPGDASSTLLRPAGSATSVPEEQLLRPANNNEATD